MVAWGFRDLYGFSLALLGKQGWKFASELRGFG